MEPSESLLKPKPGQEKEQGCSGILQTLKESRNQILATAIATIGSFGTGTVFGWSAVATDDIYHRRDFGTISKENEISWVTSLAILGAFVAGPVAGFFMDRCGRKKSIFIFAFPFILGWITICSAFFVKPNGFFLLYIGRLLTGISAGSFLVVIPTYIKEVSIDSMRGILGSTMPLTLVSGILYTFVIGTYFNWAVLSALCGAVPIVLAVCLLLIPETPRFLLVNNRREEAIKSFQWLNHLKSINIAEEQLDSAFSASSIAAAQAEGQGRWRKLMTRPVAVPILITLCVLFFQQFGGVNAVTLYTVEIFRGAGDFIQPHTATIILGIVQVVFVLLSMVLVDTLGRKTLLIMSSLVMGLNLVGLGFFFYLKEKGDGSESGITWLPILTVVTYIAAYSAGVGSVVWVLASEIYNPDYRAESSTIMTSAYWIFGFVVAKTYENVKMAFKESGSFWFYGAFCLGGAIFALLFVVETKGRSSDEILAHFGGTRARLNLMMDAGDTGSGLSPVAFSSGEIINSQSDTSTNETEISNKFNNV